MEGQRVCPKPPASDPDIPLQEGGGGKREKGGERRGEGEGRGERGERGEGEGRGEERRPGEGGGREICRDS